MLKVGDAVKLAPHSEYQTGTPGINFQWVHDGVPFSVLGKVTQVWSDRCVEIQLIDEVALIMDVHTNDLELLSE